MSNNSKVLAHLSSILIGWIVFVFAAFFFLLSASYFLDVVNLEISSKYSIAFLLLLSILFGVSIGYIIVKKLNNWFCRRRKVTGIILFLILLFVALGTMPAPFTFVIEG